jgi:hypothetical protein
VLESLLFELLCGGLIWLLFAGAREATREAIVEPVVMTSAAVALEHMIDDPSERREIEDARRLRKPLTPAQRRLQQMQNCSIDSCNALTYLASDYCLRHQPSMLEKIASEPEPEPEPKAEANWWEEEN